MSKTTVPVFRPSLAEFRNFSAYIDKIDAKIGDYGLCKVRLRQSVVWSGRNDIRGALSAVCICMYVSSTSSSNIVTPQTHHTRTQQVIPPKGWYPEQPQSQAEVETLFEKLRLMVPPIKQYVSGARGAYQLALVRGVASLCVICGGSGSGGSRQGL